ncbi:MAG TPA: 4Fe-4S binding protein [Anaerolineaceae bacterium]|nr:4Fe-4S binding protein [Anaerolineaceae bacterium]HPN51103.1 4Fe-4S binding protein [Anaerolineaceae bacterium]
MKRKIIQINEEKCNGCGLCAQACHEGAIAMMDGKARLISDTYCDGLGACLPECPTGAISMVEKEANAYDEEAVKQHLAERQPAADLQQTHQHHHGGGCPGSLVRSMGRHEAAVASAPETDVPGSELSQWPVQIKLVNPRAPFLQGANLLIAADCTAYAYAHFHRDFIRGRVTLIGCPKLDDNALYAEKFAEMLAENEIKSITVVRMEVPCCGGIVQAVKNAMLSSGTIVPYNEVVINIDGSVK